VVEADPRVTPTVGQPTEPRADALRLRTERRDVGFPERNGLVVDAPGGLGPDGCLPDAFELAAGEAEHLVVDEADDPPALGRRVHRAEPCPAPTAPRCASRHVL